MRRFCAIFLVFAMLFLPFAPVARAFVLADDIIIATVIAFGAACGLTLTFAGLDDSGVLDSVGSMLDDYLSSISVSSLQEWCDSSAITVLDGLLRMSADVADKIASFWSWAQTHFSVSAGVTTEVSTDVLLPPFTVSSSFTVTSLLDSHSVLSAAYTGLAASGIGLTYGSDAYDTLIAILDDIDGAYTLDIYVGRIATSSVETVVYVPVTPLLIGNTHSPSDPSYVAAARASLSNPGSTMVTISDPFLLNDPTGYGTGPAVTGAGFNGYHYLISNVNGSFTSTSIIGADAIDVPQDVVTPGWIDVGAPSTATLDEVTDQVVDDAIAGELVPVLDLSETQPGPLEPTPSPGPVVPGWPEQLPTIPVSSLTDKLPFCIPGDLISIIGALQAEPLAPVIELDFEPWGLPDTVISLDLSRFDDVAVLCRRLELVLYVVGLAVATRRIYIRG